MAVNLEKELTEWRDKSYRQAALIRRLSSEVDEYQQQQDEIIVALGSAGTLRSEIVNAVKRQSSEVSNLKLANKEARKTIDRLNAMIPQEANSGSDPADPILDNSSD